MSSPKEIDPRKVSMVRAFQDLRKHDDPKIAFAMSPSMRFRAMLVVKHNAQELGLSEDEAVRARQIRGHEAHLKRIGFPLWRSGVSAEGESGNIEVSAGNGKSNSGYYEATPGEIVSVGDLVVARS